jgi:hypothetical protein
VSLRFSCAASAHKEPFPADMLLRLYAHIKKASNTTKDRCKTHCQCIQNKCALFQIKDVSEDEAVFTLI